MLVGLVRPLIMIRWNLTKGYSIWSGTIAKFPLPRLELTHFGGQFIVLFLNIVFKHFPQPARSAATGIFDRPANGVG